LISSGAVGPVVGGTRSSMLYWCPAFNGQCEGHLSGRRLQGAGAGGRRADPARRYANHMAARQELEEP
jgi:hypothetical protein